MSGGRVQFLDNGLHEVSALKSLRKLNLGGKPSMMTLARLEFIPLLPRLEELELYINDDGLKHLASMQQLRELHILSDDVTDNGLVYLRDLSNLKLLRIWSASVSARGLSHLTGLSNLRELHLYGKQITEDGVANLRRALPNCTIKVNQPY